MTLTLCAAGATAHRDEPCDGDPFGLVLRYQPTDFGGTTGCPRHTALLQTDHPGSVIVPAADAIGMMQTFAEHPDLAGLDEDLDGRYGHH